MVGVEVLQRGAVVGHLVDHVVRQIREVSPDPIQGQVVEGSKLGWARHIRGEIVFVEQGWGLPVVGIVLEGAIAGESHQQGPAALQLAFVFDHIAVGLEDAVAHLQPIDAVFADAALVDGVAAAGGAGFDAAQDGAAATTADLVGGAGGATAAAIEGVVVDADAVAEQLAFVVAAAGFDAELAVLGAQVTAQITAAAVAHAFDRLTNQFAPGIARAAELAVDTAWVFTTEAVLLHGDAGAITTMGTFATSDAATEAAPLDTLSVVNAGDAASAAVVVGALQVGAIGVFACTLRWAADALGADRTVAAASAR